MEVVMVGVYCEPNMALVVYGKRKLRSMMWRVRAEVRRQLSNNNKNKQQQKQRKFSLQYDPSSYALNFDNGDFGFFCL